MQRLNARPYCSSSPRGGDLNDHPQIRRNHIIPKFETLTGILLLSLPLRQGGGWMAAQAETLAFVELPVGPLQ